MKFSIITVTKNSADTIRETLASITNQTFTNYQHIAVDSHSTDGTLQILKEYLPDKKNKILQDNKKGIYDAINIGINNSDGEIVALLHSDDCFYDDQVLQRVARYFKDSDINVLYGNVRYISRFDRTKVIRKWTCGEFSFNKLKNGWMPPHLGIFIKRDFLIKEKLKYLTNLKISGDYEFILRLFLNPSTKSRYIDNYLVDMKFGGESNKSVANLLVKYREDFYSLKKNQLNPYRGLFFKNVRKLNQFF